MAFPYHAEKVFWTVSKMGVVRVMQMQPNY